MVRQSPAFLLACAFSVVAAMAADRPNVVLIVIDDLGYTDTAPYGSVLHQTPNIARLAAEGIRFTNYYAASPVCSPTRASLLTGRNPARLRLTNFLKGLRRDPNSPVLPADYADCLDPEEVTLAEALKPFGYATAHIGKWHLAKRGGDGQDLPQAQGFDINIGGTHSGMPRSFFWPRWRGNPPVQGEFDGQYLPDFLSMRAVQFIRAHRDRPFFLYLAHYAVHIPIQAPSADVARYRRRLANRPARPWEHFNPYYAAMVEAIDRSVGRVLAALEECGLTDRTYVIFTSDNGGLVTREGPHTPATTCRPLRLGKGYVYEGGIRVPFIVRGPGVARGAVSDELAISDDVFPTVLDLIGIAPDSVPSAGPRDGLSLAAELRAPQTTRLPRDTLYFHYPHFSNQGGRPSGAIRKGDWKAIISYETGKVELYDLSKDPGESSNLAARYPERARELARLHAKWREQLRVNMPRRKQDSAPTN